MQEKDLKFLENKAKEIRRTVLKMLCKAKSGHTGGSLSCVEILLTLYYRVMRHNPKKPNWAERDRFVLSKGHAAPTLYAVLADRGYFPKEKLWTLRKFGSLLQGHPINKLPGVEIPTGALGHGLSISNGMALAARIDKKDYKVYCLMGDGEINEGEIWEAVMTAKHYKLSNVIGIIDNNGQQLDGFTKDIKDTHPLADKFRAFGWETLVVDGHDFAQLISAFTIANQKRESPTMVIAKTIKGKGVSFMENNLEFHGRAPTEEELKWALMQLQ